MPEYITIQTARNVEIEYRVAGLGDRIIARLIDSIIVIGYIFLLLILTASFNSGIFMSIFLLPALFYTFLFERFNNGQTPGKNIIMTRVVSTDGNHVTTGMYFIRWLLLLIDLRIATGVIGIISILVSSKGQRLGDIAAGTTVVSLKKQASVEKSVFRKISPNYKPTYPQVVHIQDDVIQTIRKVIRTRAENKYELVTLAADRLEEVYGIKKNASSLSFLNTIVKDYNYYQSQLHQQELGHYDEEDTV
jgi:uncharacterized RDD family membrane protein YckC